MKRKFRLLTDDERKKGESLAMMEAQETKRQLVEARRKRVLHSDSTKIEVVKTFIAMGGNLSQTAGACNISYKTLEAWKATNWWKNLLAELKKAEKLELSTKTKAILDKSLDLLHDRLDKGDVFFHPKTGELTRKPLDAKAINQIAKDMLDRKNILDKAFENTVPETSKDDKLASLAERFAKLAEASLEHNKKPPVEVTDVVFVTEKKEPQCQE